MDECFLSFKHTCDHCCMIRTQTHVYTCENELHEFVVYIEHTYTKYHYIHKELPALWGQVYVDVGHTWVHTVADIPRVLYYAKSN